MTETIRRVKLAELTTIRVSCAKCGVVLESKIEDVVGEKTKFNTCQGCGTEFFASFDNPLQPLQTAMADLLKNARISTEFVIVEN